MSARASLLLVVLLSRPAVAEAPPPKLELDLTSSDVNGVAVPLGFANAFLGGAGGGVQMAAGLQGLLKRLGPVLSSGKVPRSTEEANKLLGAGVSMRGVRSNYQARVRATLVKQGDDFVVESGTVQYSLSTNSTLAVKDAAIIDRVSASGSSKLEPGAARVRFSPPAKEGAPPTWALSVSVTHPIAPTGFSDWSVKDGKVMGMHLDYAGDAETISGSTMGQPWPKETSTQKKMMGLRYETTGQEVTRHTPRRSATWTDLTGTQHAVTFTLRWQSDVSAEFTPKSPERGEPLELDGSASKGKELTWEWRFEVPPGSCFTDDTGNASAKKTGKKVSAVLLCDTRVTLRVTDFKHESDENTQLVKVRPRQFKPVKFDARKESWEALGQLAVQGGGVLAAKPWGLNRCARNDSTDHFIHRDAADPGFKGKEVQDQDGPFDGWWYVDSHSLEAPRARVINVELAPQTPKGTKACDTFSTGANVYGVNQACNVRNGRVVYDVETARQATSFHEEQHAAQFSEALGRIKPHRVIEKAIGRTEAQLRERAGCMLGVADGVIEQWGNNEVEVAFRVTSKSAYAKEVSLKLRTDGSDLPTVKVFPKIGDKENHTATPGARAKEKQKFEQGVQDFEPNAKACKNL